MAVTLDDVALKAKLSKGSVSRILNGKHEGYSAETRQRVLETAAALGYQPNALSRALWTGQTQTIALWTHLEDDYSPYFGYWQHQAQKLVDRDGYKMITESVPLVAPEATAQLRSSAKAYWPVDGILACSLNDAAVRQLYAVAKAGCPIVMMHPVSPPGEGNPARPGTDYILFDFYDGARQAIEHLLGAGCRRIGFVTQPYMMVKDQRGHAYRDLMAAAGKPEEVIPLSDDTRGGGYAAAKAYIAQHGCPDGLFCANDEVALGCYVALHELGLRVPGDVLLVGFDGLENARLLPHPISSVSVPLEEMSTLSWQMLLQRIQNPDLPPRQHILPTQLEIRASSQPAPRT